MGRKERAEERGWESGYSNHGRCRGWWRRCMSLKNPWEVDLVTVTNFSLPPFGPGKHMALTIISPAGSPAGGIPSVSFAPIRSRLYVEGHLLTFCVRSSPSLYPLSCLFRMTL